MPAGLAFCLSSPGYVQRVCLIPGSLLPETALVAFVISNPTLTADASVMMNREILADHLNRERVRQQSVPPGPEDKVPKRIAPRDTTCALPSEGIY